MQRPITGFHQDDHADWVAELSCGHGQHVRHEPPFTLRPWVMTGEGRASRLGQQLDCVRCDRLELPDGFLPYKRTAVFDAMSVPRGLLSEHSTKAGVWGRLKVTSGTLNYVLAGDPPQRTEVHAGQSQLIAPEAKHHIELSGPVEFTVEFLRKDG